MKKVNPTDSDGPEDYFPMIESVHVSSGNKFENTAYNGASHVTPPIRVGDSIEILVNAKDPKKGKLFYRFSLSESADWSTDNKKTLVFREQDIGITTVVQIAVKSDRNYHAQGEFDSVYSLIFVVLPRE